MILNTIDYIVLVSRPGVNVVYNNYCCDVWYLFLKKISIYINIYNSEFTVLFVSFLRVEQWQQVFH